MKFAKIAFFLLLLCTNFFGAEKQSIKTTGKKYKIFLSDFRGRKIPQKFSFFTSSLPRSIRTVLKNNHKVKYSKKSLSRKKLANKGYELVIKGWLIKKGNDFVVEFFIIHIKTNSILILADITGDADRRIFDLVDLMCNNITKILNKQIDKLKADPEIISIDREGKISVKKLANSDLSERNLSNINLSNLNISSADLKNSNLRNSELRNSDLSKTDFTGADLRNADLSGANLKGAVFKNTKLKGANLSNTDLSGMNFKGYDLRNVNFTDTTLSNTDFTKADLTAAKFNNAIIYKTNFNNAKLDNLGDFNIGLQGFFGAFGWFTAEGRIYKNFFVGIKAGYSAEMQGENKNLSVLITSTFYLLDYSVFNKPLFRPYIGFGSGYRFSLNHNGAHSFISAVYAGVEFFPAHRLSLYFDAGGFYNGDTFYPSIGAGVRIHLPNIKSEDYGKVTILRTEKAKKMQSKEQTKSKQFFKLLAIKFSAGISMLYQSADNEIPEDLKMGMKFSYGLGARFFFLRDNFYGFIADIEYLDLGGRQNSDSITGITHIHYFSINALFALKPFNNFFVGLGFYFAIPVGAQVNYSKPSETNADVYEMYKNPDFGGIFSVSYIFDLNEFYFFAGMDFRISIVNVYRELDTIVAPYNYAVRNLAVLINVGVGL